MYKVKDEMLQKLRVHAILTQSDLRNPFTFTPTPFDATENISESAVQAIIFGPQLGPQHLPLDFYRN